MSSVRSTNPAQLLTIKGTIAQLSNFKVVLQLHYITFGEQHYPVTFDDNSGIKWYLRYQL